MTIIDQLGQNAKKASLALIQLPTKEKMIFWSC